jgi:hypothetical protein
LVETTGYKLDCAIKKKDAKKSKEVKVAVDKLDVAEAKNEVDGRVKAKFKEGEALLA